MCYNLEMSYPDFVGRKFGRLTVLSRAPNASHRRGRRWLCCCECGKTLIVRGDCLPNGNTTSCGCFYKETRKAKLSHGHCENWTRSSEYSIWVAMKQRCCNPNNSAYQHYGGRGITVCQGWLDSFIAFYKSVGPRPTSKHSIDRINNDGNYEPSNVRWATKTQQLANRRPYIRRIKSFQEQPASK